MSFRRSPSRAGGSSSGKIPRTEARTSCAVCRPSTCASCRMSSASRGRGGRVPARRDIGTGLLVQPPTRQVELGSHRQCFLENDAVRLEEGIDVTSGPARVVCKGHCSTAEHLEVCHHAAPGKPVAQTAVRLLDGRAVEQWRGIAHAASILVVGDEHAPPAEGGRCMHERLCARLACRTGTRNAATRGMPTTPARPCHLAWQGARQAPRRARPSAHRRSVPALPRTVPPERACHRR